MKYWGTQGAYWGGLWGMLFGAAFFAIPGLGPMLVAGPLVAWIVGALEGAVVMVGLSAFGAGLYSIGIPKDSVSSTKPRSRLTSFYSRPTAAGRGRQARDIMQTMNPIRIAVHAAEREEPVLIGER